MNVKLNWPATRTYLSGGWRKHLLAAAVLIVLGLAVWPQRISRAEGFLLDDSPFLYDTYERRLELFPGGYLPGAGAIRPIGRDAFTLLVRFFGEKVKPMIWLLLTVHLGSTLLVWQALYRLNAAWWASLGGATFFLLGMSAYLPIYWPVAIFDTLSTFFLACLLLTTALIIRPRGKYRPWLLSLTLPLLLAAVKSKESAIVVIVPLFVMVFFPVREGRRAEPGGRFGAGAMIRRLRDVTFWEVVWLVLSVTLAAVLALTVASPLGSKTDPTHPYYPEYTPGVLGRSFVFYLSLLVFRYVDSAPVPPYLGLVLALAPFAAALALRNRWLLYGWLWYVVFLLPLAALKNHYAYIYYPYPANIGVAMALAGLFAGVRAPAAIGEQGAGVFRRALPAVFVLVMFQHSYAWMKSGFLPQWYDDFHARSEAMIRSLKRALPAPPPGSEFVLVIPELSQFSAAPGALLKIIYRDPTLTGAAFEKPQEAEAYASRRAARNTFLATWRGDGFEVQKLAPP